MNNAVEGIDGELVFTASNDIETSIVDLFNTENFGNLYQNLPSLFFDYAF